MTSNIIQKLIDTWIEHPVEDVERWVDRLTTLSEEFNHGRNADPQLLTRNEAEVIVRYYGSDQSRSDVADAMGLSPNRIDRLRYAAEDDLLAAEATLTVLSDLREQVRPDPYKDP